jgi:hypothetical protein
VERPGSELVFSSSDAAKAAAARLNADPTEWPYSPWYVGSAGDGEWWVVRARGYDAADYGDPARYESALRDGVETITADRDYWEKLEGIAFETVALEGCYPDTELVLLFRRRGREECLFGVRRQLWPAPYRTVDEALGLWAVEFLEFLGTSPRARLVATGPCVAGRVNWL